MNKTAAADAGGAAAAEFYAPKVCIIGVGLIGGSLALALKRGGCIGEVIGVGRTQKSLRLALDLGVIDRVAESPAAAVAAADITVLATPVTAIAELFPAIAAAVSADKTITDVGSVKAGVCDSARAALGENFARFVPGHPVAGKEHSGVAAAAADLFESHATVLTPLPETAAAAVDKIRKMWQAAGASVCEMPAETHDQVLAMTSHLPHILAYAMMDLFANAECELPHARDMVAGGFYDFTRTVSSEPEMWRDICAMNRAEIIARVDQFTARLNRLRDLVEAENHTAIAEMFAHAKTLRAALAKRHARRN